MMKGKKSIFSIRKDSNLSSLSTESNAAPQPAECNRWHQEILEKLLQKGNLLERSRQETKKLIEKKNTLESKIKDKNKEAHLLNDKILILTQELSAVKRDHLQALEEIRALKRKVHELAHKNEVMEQEKDLCGKIKKQLIKSEHLFIQQKLKTQSLERSKLNPHKWRTLQYTDPHYFELLQKKNYLQSELQKKLDLLQAKDMQLRQKDNMLENLKSMLKRRPFQCINEPEKHMMACYKTIREQNEKIKSLSGQVNMYESLISNRLPV